MFVGESFLGSTTPNDQFFNQQWVHDFIESEKAWDISIGSTDVSVAIIDAGLKGGHNDFAGNIDINYIGYQYDYANSTISYYDHSPSDKPGHGTKVAGIIGARGNNCVGISGVCWRVNMIPLSFYDVYGNWYNSMIANAIQFATQNNIPIINFSSYSINGIDSSVESAIESYPGLFVCCAGNSGLDMDNTPYFDCYPSELQGIDNLISVGSLDDDGSILSTSNYGATSVDLFAPGNNVLSTDDAQNPYGPFSGTSCATPFVAGTAALLKAINPNLTTAQLKAAILNNVDQVDSLNGKCVTGGKLNVYKAANSVVPVLESSSTRTVTSGCYNWEKIVVNSPATYSFSISGNTGITMSLAFSPLLESPLETATIQTGQTSASFSHLFTVPGTYYIKVSNDIYTSTTYTITKTFMSYHYHSYSGPLIWLDNATHGKACYCGEIGMISSHIVKLNNPNVCTLCGGYANLNEAGIIILDE